ncbi:MAG TPA: DUF6265 family protein, partial [Thermoanaerobaculia bacterium]|nr:DUF6265 family protein [Thermoanaerobaculia bacterium]
MLRVQRFGLMMLVLASTSAPAAASAPERPAATLADLAWMTGSWEGTSGEVRMEEHWTAPAGGLMVGMHRDVGEGRSFFEFLRLEETAAGITYLASPRGRPATPFPLVEVGEQRAVFANPEHDFPQRIVYWREGARLCARIEGPG